MADIEALKAKRTKLWDDVNKVAETINKMELAEILPPLKKKYIGKWFKRTDKDDDSKTTTYTKVLDVVGRNEAQTLSIKIEYRIKTKDYEFVLVQNNTYDYLTYIGTACEYKEVQDLYYKALQSIQGNHI